MKKNLLLCIVFSAVCFTAGAQSKPGKKYLNIGYVSEHLKNVEENYEGEKVKSKFGASLSSGRTFFLTATPVAKVLYFGIDWTYLDLNYGQFKESGSYSYEDGNGNMVIENEDYVSHKGEVGMQVGPSVHVGLTDGFSVSGHVRYAPSYSLLYADEEFSGGFGNFFTAGLAANYGIFGIGVETRWGSATHRFNVDIGELEEQEVSVKDKLKLSGSRVFLALRF